MKEVDLPEGTQINQSLRAYYKSLCSKSKKLHLLRKIRPEKRTKQSAQINIPKRNPPTLSLFIPPEFRPKQHKNIPSHSHTTELVSQHASQYAPPPVPIPPLPPPQKPHTTPKYQPLLHSPSPPLLYNIFPPLLYTIFQPPPPLLYTILSPLSPTPLFPALPSTPPLPSVPSTLPPPPPPPHKHKSHPSWNSKSLSRSDSALPQCQ